MSEKNIITFMNLDSASGFLVSEQPFLWDSCTVVTAKQFYCLAERFAGVLLEKGLWNQPVAILAKHRLETLIMYFGTLLSGNYYLPIAEDVTESKKQEMLKLTGTEEIYTEADIPKENCVGDDISARLKAARDRLPDEAPLYIIYTSGSTGKPKGIVKTHENMIAFLKSYTQTFSFSENDVLANQTPFCFDASAKDFYLMLFQRIPMYIVDNSMFFRPKELVNKLNAYQVSILQWVPSALSMLSQLKSFEKEKPNFLRRVSFVGEVFPVKQLRYWMEKLPQVEFVNLYGASELAGVCSYYQIPSIEQNSLLWDTFETKGIPLGKPLPHQKLFLLQEGKVVTEPGCVGEICIQSEGLADGYLSSENDSREVFVSKISADLPQGKYYKTGDLGRYDDVGNLYYVNRIDYQIKHMGHRIELGEIELAALQTDGVEKAAAIFEKGKIKLYCEGVVEQKTVEKSLRNSLSEYMLPQKIQVVEKLPLNPNGKIDRMSLLESK